MSILGLSTSEDFQWNEKKDTIKNIDIEKDISSKEQLKSEKEQQKIKQAEEIHLLKQRLDNSNFISNISDTDQEIKEEWEKYMLPSISLDQIFDYWIMQRYSILHEWKKMGFIDVWYNQESPNITIWDVEINKSERGKRIGIATYIQLVNMYQKPIISYMQSDEANRMRESLVRIGLSESLPQEQLAKWYKFKELAVLLKEWKASKNASTWKIEIKTVL